MTENRIKKHTGGRLLIPFLFILAGFFNTLSAQSTDSLKQVLTQKIPDSTYYKTAVDIAWSYMYTNTDSAIYYGNLALKKATAIPDKLNIANANNTLGVCYIVLGNYYEALRYLNAGQKLAEELYLSDTNEYKYARRLLAIHTNIGNVYYFQSKFDKAIDNYLKTLHLSEKIGFQNGISIATSNIGASYLDMLDYDKALEYNYKALAIAQKSGNNAAITQCLNNLGSIYYATFTYDSAYNYFKKCIEINRADNYEHELITNYVNMADVYSKTSKPDSALLFYKKALELGKKLKSTNGVINIYYMMGEYFKDTRQFDSAVKYLKKSIELARENGSIRFIMLANEELADVYKTLGDYKKAYEHFKEGRDASDSIFNIEKSKLIADMESKYQAQKKENKIKFLNEKNNLLKENVLKNKIMFGSLVALLILTIILILLSYRSYKLKQLAGQQKLKRENEKKLIKAIVETEVKERNRFANDLHDGLGALLSTVKLYVNEINNVNDERKEEIIGASSKMLDDAIQTTRNICNNILPAGLRNNGLIPAVKAFSEKINASGKIHIEINDVNVKERLPDILEVNLYFVLTELINNSLKYSECDTISIIFTQKEDSLYVSYNDNGKGFDFQKVKESKERGRGLTNLINRVRAIGGNCIFDSGKGKGFFAGIEVSLAG